MRTTHLSLLGILTLLTASLAAIPASAAPADTHVTLSASEGPDCLTSQGAYCFEVTNGSLEDWPAGGIVHLTLENTGSLTHNAYITNASNADQTRLDTPSSAAFASTDTADAGATVNTTFTVPEDASELYLWCDIQGHERFGMWTTATVTETPTDGTPQDPGNNDTDGDTNGSTNDTDGDPSGEENGSPAPGVLALLTLAGASAATIQRRKD